MFPFFGICWCEVICYLWDFFGVQLASLSWIFPSSTFCKSGFVNRYCSNLVLSWNILFSPLVVIESFSGYSSLGLHLGSFIVCSISVQDHLAFMISIEKSGTILLGLPLYVTWPFFLAALNILYSVCLVC